MIKPVIFMCLFSLSAVCSAKQCSDHFSSEELQTLKRNNFEIKSAAKRNSTALNLLVCVGHSNPQIRDGIVYEASRYWLRNQLITLDTVKAMFDTLTQILVKQDENDSRDHQLNFTQPFAALVLSEVVRVDRITPFLSIADRQTVVEVSTHYMQNIRDYRGFSDSHGWRHAVAHTADVFLQLALNENITKNQLDLLLEAINSQVNPSKEHFYIYGEPKRLAMPFMYIILRGNHSDKEVLDFLKGIANPAPFSNWQSVYNSNNGLAKLHNTREFIYSVLAMTVNSQNPKLVSLQLRLAELIKEILLQQKALEIF